MFELGMLALAATAVGLIALHYAQSNPERRARHMLQQSPLCSLDSAQEGEVIKVVGTLRDVEDPLEAPLSGRRCAYYEILVEQRPELRFEPRGFESDRDRVKSERWVVRVGRDFELDDGSGKPALVRMERATVRITYDRHYRSGGFDTPTPAMRQLLNRHLHIGGQGLSLQSNIRYSEGILEVGERVAVRGRVLRDVVPGAGRGYRDHAHRVMLAPSIEEGELYVSDDPALV